MTYTRESVIEAYQGAGSLKGACVSTGCPPYVAFIWLTEAKMLNTADKSHYGTRTSRMGSAAESEFQRLVPHAMSANQNLQGNCPSFDFDVDGVTVDVKYASLQEQGRWTWRMCRDKPLKPDFVVVFLVANRSGQLSEGYRLLVLPEPMFPDRASMALTPRNAESPLWEFEIAPTDLAEFLEVAA